MKLNRVSNYVSNMAVILAVLVLLAGCTTSEGPAAPSEVPSAPEESTEPTAHAETGIEKAPGKEAKEELTAEKKEPVATNEVKLVQQDGYVGLNTKEVVIATGSSVTFKYAGAEKGKTVVTILTEDGKLLPSQPGKAWSSGYLTAARDEWTSPPFETPGTYVMKITFGKADEGKIMVK